tara:strand:- start:1256 stop:1639 length:384 start_codon:yes stop_codon:yes gene_type:complete
MRRKKMESFGKYLLSELREDNIKEGYLQFLTKNGEVEASMDDLDMLKREVYDEDFENWKSVSSEKNIESHINFFEKIAIAFLIIFPFALVGAILKSSPLTQGILVLNILLIGGLAFYIGAKSQKLKN